MRWFFGYSDPYRATLPPPKYWPRILTVSWWRWCLAEGCNGVAKERLRVYYIRYIKPVLRHIAFLPICMFVGHNKVEESDWSYNRIKCKRCGKIVKRIR